MITPTEGQIAALLQQYSSILVCLPAKPTTDAIASGLAMYSLLQKLGKNAKVVAAGFALPSNHRFLPKSAEIQHDLTALKKFVIGLDISRTKVADLNYDIQGDRLNIYVAPKNGYFTVSDVSTSSTDYEFDLIITLDARDLDSLGKVFEDNAEFFHHTPLINIDHHPGNEHFGQVNQVKVTATSISEIVFELMEHIDAQLVDEYIATNLLTGIISKTKSFKTNTVTPRSLAIASHLIASGARREDIVKNLYQTKSLNMLQLWGRTLTRLQADTDHKIVWSILREQDFIETNTGPYDLEQVIDELIVNTPDAENVYLIYQHTATGGKQQVHAIVYTAPYIRGLEAFSDWAAHGSDHFTYVTFPLISLETAQVAIHERLRKLVR
ncbi:MAG: hypothetical protein HYV33_02890 [Candidatus Kerfeldbacteria bacterium]|nr:hypothetical protein [Candidatus Kerfeldbacteria bacterium]